ncbi:MAG: chromate transporter [Deltaproteobacteria bacterium]|nr:chromate transporter [Deltaproteobacteria bacterium]
MVIPSLGDIARYFLLLGATVFGGPLALVAHIEQELVERRRWLTMAECKEGLAMATALPGPIAYQLGIYAAWLRQGWRGGCIAAVAFAVPPFLLCLLGAILYKEYQASWIVQGLFYGMSPVVIALIVKAGYKMGKATFTDPFSWAVGIAAAVLVSWYRIDPTLVFVAAGLAGIGKTYALAPSRPRALSFELGLFFFKAACVLFGSGLVIIPFLQRYVVDQYHWMDARTFVDGVAIGMMTPGPVVITATFVGYIVDGIAGAGAATLGMFAPSVLFVFLGAPLMRRWGRLPAVHGAVGGIAAAVVGVIMGASIGVAKTALPDLLACGIAGGSLLATLRTKVPDLVLICAAGAIGLLTARV